MIYEQTLTPDNDQQGTGIRIPGSIRKFIEKWVKPSDLEDLVLVKKASELSFIHAINRKRMNNSGLGCIVCLLKMNDIPHINAFLKSANQKLHNGGFIIGCMETQCDRKQRLMARQGWPLNIISRFFDYFRKRVWTKLPIVNRYYHLSGETGRDISEIEAYGRLFSCGFSLSGTKKIGGKQFFAAQKTSLPDFSHKPSTGLLISLERIGQHGKPVKVYKVRTMHPYSEYIQEFIFNQNGFGSGCKFKDDPRITPIGRFLRKYWLDELPMMVNLAKGDVKLFGVRPVSPHYLNLFPEDFKKYRCQFKPGLIPPLYVEIPNSIEDIMAIERRYLEAYEQRPLLTDLTYTYKALYNIIVRRVRSK